MDNIKKYPKSKNNYQCLGPCYYPGTMVVHPTQLEIVTEYVQPFCPVDEWKFVDSKSGKSFDKITDMCYNPTEKKNISNKDLELNILTPFIDFNSEHFLKIYYKIFSFEDAIDWLENNMHVPLGTRIRIINCGLKSFGNTIELFDMRFCDFFIEFIKKREIKYIYAKIRNNIGANTNGEIYIVEKHNNSLKDTENCTERTNYILKTFLNKEEITKFLQKYFKHRSAKWKEIDNHLYDMLSDLTIYILNKITLTLQKNKH